MIPQAVIQSNLLDQRILLAFIIGSSFKFWVTDTVLSRVSMRDPSLVPAREDATRNKGGEGDVSRDLAFRDLVCHCLACLTLSNPSRPSGGAIPETKWC